MGIKKEHPSWGARKIRDKLRKQFPVVPTPAISTIHAVLDRHPQVLRVICGHVHRNVFGQVGRTPASIAPSPAHLVALDLREEGPSAFRLEPAGFQLHRFADGRLVTHNVTLGDWPGPFPFFEPDGRLID